MKKLLLILLVTLGLQTQAQINWCDSVSYTSMEGLPLMVYGNADGISNMVDSIDWYFTACNAITCYLPQGNNPYSFPFINYTDTVKLCYDAYIYSPFTNNFTCTECDSLVFDLTDSTWVLMNMGNTVGIEELMKNEGANNIMYDMLGRELTEIPLGEMYIKNKKLYITR